jgi:hypothetical protein
MKKIKYTLIIILFLVSCTSKDHNKPESIKNDNKILELKNDTIITPYKILDDTIPDIAIWANYFIWDYIEHHSKRLKEINGYHISYLKDIETIDGRKYAKASIGYNLEIRFVTEQIIFIDSINKNIYEYDVFNDSLKPWSKFKRLKSSQNEIPASGTYQFDAAFAEWDGKSMGLKLTVIINGDSVKVIYEGQGSLTAEIGEVIDEGIIMKHKSGEWIIGNQISDKDLNDVGGCTEGPAIIDFKNKKYWLC